MNWVESWDVWYEVMEMNVIFLLNMVYVDCMGEIVYVYNVVMLVCEEGWIWCDYLLGDWFELIWQVYYLFFVMLFYYNLLFGWFLLVNQILFDVIVMVDNLFLVDFLQIFGIELCMINCVYCGLVLLWGEWLLISE